MNDDIIHGTAIAVAANGVLLTGPSGSGKSDLALRLIDRGAKLVSDDSVSLNVVEGMLMLAAAPNIEGKLEVRGIGIRNIEPISSVPLRLVVDLCSDIPRMPPEGLTTKIMDFDVPFVRLAPFEASAPLKVEYALSSVIDAEHLPVAKNLSDETESIPS